MHFLFQAEKEAVRQLPVKKTQGPWLHSLGDRPRPLTGSGSGSKWGHGEKFLHSPWEHFQVSPSIIPRQSQPKNFLMFGQQNVWKTHRYIKASACKERGVNEGEIHSNWTIWELGEPQVTPPQSTNPAVLLCVRAPLSSRCFYFELRLNCLETFSMWIRSSTHLLSYHNTCA